MKQNNCSAHKCNLHHFPWIRTMNEQKSICDFSFPFVSDFGDDWAALSRQFTSQNDEILFANLIVFTIAVCARTMCLSFLSVLRSSSSLEWRTIVILFVTPDKVLCIFVCFCRENAATAPRHHENSFLFVIPYTTTRIHMCDNETQRNVMLHEFRSHAMRSVHHILRIENKNQQQRLRTQIELIHLSIGSASTQAKMKKKSEMKLPLNSLMFSPFLSSAFTANNIYGRFEYEKRKMRCEKPQLIKANNVYRQSRRHRSKSVDKHNALEREISLK